MSDNISRLIPLQDDRLQLQDHLRSEHETEDEEGLEYLIAGCLMNSEERQAIVNVVKVGRVPLYLISKSTFRIGSQITRPVRV